jgi:hypothetical protein
MRDERLLLDDIIDALDRIDSFTWGLSSDSFLQKKNETNFFLVSDRHLVVRGGRVRIPLTLSPVSCDG